jgi:four helix bundle protein
MNEQVLKQRTKAFALRAIKMVDALPKNRSADVLGRQLLRSGTSVAANYRAACRSRSPAEFLAKMGIVEEEADECGLWIELIGDSGLQSHAQLAELLREANELTAISVASIKTARSNLKGRCQ